MADKSNGDFFKRPVQDSHDHEKPLPTPRQETGVPQGSELVQLGQPQQLQGEFPPNIRKLAVFIEALLVYLSNLPAETFTNVYTMGRAAAQYFHIPTGDIKEMETMKHKGVEIKNQLKESCDEISKLEKSSNFQNQSTVDLGEWGRNLRIARDQLATLAKCGIDIKFSQGLVSRLVSDAQTVVMTSLVITILLASAAMGYWYYCTAWKGGSFIFLLLFPILHQNRVAFQMVQTGNRVKRELEESRCRYKKYKVTLKNTLSLSREVVNKYDGGSLSKKIKNE